MKVTWHDPCHLGRRKDVGKVSALVGLSVICRRTEKLRLSGVFDAPRTILQAIPGIEFAEMEADTGVFLVLRRRGGVKSAFPAFALHSAQERIAEASETGRKQWPPRAPGAS